MPQQTINLRGVAAQLVLGALALALVFAACFRLDAGLATVAFACLIVVVLFSLMGNFIASVLLSALAVAGLDYLFAAPISQFAIDDPREIALLAAFFLTALGVDHLIRRAHKEKEAAIGANAVLRRSLAELRDREQQWREVFEHNPVMYFMLDAEGIVLNVNTLGAMQLGYAVDDIIGQSVLKVFLPEDHDLVHKCLAACLETVGQSHTWELHKIRRDGSRLWVRENAKAMRRSDGRLVVLIACEDITARRDTEAALQRSQAYLAQAQELSHTGSFGWNVATNDVYWSSETHRIFACDPSVRPSPELVVERTHPDDRADVRAVIERALREHEDFDHEYRLLLPDGTVKHLHALARATINGAGDLEFVGAVTDMTQAKQAEQKLEVALAEIKTSEDRLRLVIDTIPALVWRTRADGAAEFFNQRCLDYTGLSMDRSLGWGWTSAVHPDDVDALLGTWYTLRLAGQPGEAEARLRRFDGAYRWFLFRMRPLRDEEGRILMWYGSATDIEDRKQTEVALRASEQRFRDYAETASDWLWETGPDHRVTQLSEHSRTSGVLATGVVGLLRWQSASGSDADAEKWREHRATLDAHLPFRDLVYQTENGMGAPIYVRTSGKPVFDAGGKFLGYRGLSTDITAVIRAEEAEQALRKAQAELAHVTRVTMLGELTASIAHEINQPLAGLIANAEACLGWLRRSPPNLAAAGRSVEWIIEDGNRAGEVIRRVRDLAKKTNAEMSLLDINELAREAMALLQRELSRGEVSLRMDLAPRLPTICGDRVQLQQVIINLVLNGIEAMQSVNGRPRRLTIPTGRDEVGRVCLSVADTGDGISEADADRIFTPFFTTKSGGMGMGLAICRSIVEAHGGRLSTFRNEEGGATFQFVLPPHQEAAA